MKAVLTLTLKSAWARRLTLGIARAAIAISSALLLAVERVRHDARQSFTQSISGVDLVVGARTGGVQRMLYAVFHSGAATNNIRWNSFAAIANHPAVAWAVPFSLRNAEQFKCRENSAVIADPSPPGRTTDRPEGAFRGGFYWRGASIAPCGGHFWPMARLTGATSPVPDTDSPKQRA